MKTRLLTCMFLQCVAFFLFSLNGFAQTPVVAPSGQVGWWSGDGNANDIAGTNNGTLQNNATHTIGKVGQGFSFNGADAVVATPNSTLNNPFPTISIEGWVNPATHGTDASGIFGKTIVSNTNGDGFALRLLNGVIQSDLRLTGGDARTTFGTALPLNVWSHVALTYDGMNVRAFLNGVQVGSDFPASGTVKNTANGGICLFIGGDPSPACTADTGFGFNGGIDELSIYNRAITPAEITSIFNAGTAGKLKQNATLNSSSLVSLWQGEGNANDTRGINNGSLLDGATFAAGRFGQAFQFVPNQRVLAPDSASLDLTNAVTIETWISPQQFGGAGNNSSVVLKGSIGGASGESYSLMFFSNGSAALRLSNGSTIEHLFSGAILPLNTFSHIVGTYDGTTMKFYVNGILTNSAVSSLGTLNNSTGPMLIGSNGIGPYDGKLDEVAIYDRALSQGEVRANYEAGNALSTVVGDARVTFPTVSTAGITQQIPLDLSTLPNLPIGSTTTGLTYDIATTATFTGSPQVCFNLPSVTNSTIFNNLRIAHLESSVWVNRTDLASINFATKTVCTSGLTSLSPFAVVNGFAPSAANAAISGQIRTANGSGIRNAVVRLTNTATGEIRAAQTGSFGRYSFADLAVGQIYIVSVEAKRYEFANPTQIVNLTENVSNADFVSQDK